MHKIEEIGEPGVLVRPEGFNDITCGEAALMLQTKQKGRIFYKIRWDESNAKMVRINLHA